MIEISHIQARRMIRQGLDRRLPEEQWVILQAHLDVCAECRDYRERHRLFEKDIRHALQRRWRATAGPRADVVFALRARENARQARRRLQKRAVSGLGMLLLFSLCSLLTWQMSIAPSPPTVEPTRRATRTPPAWSAAVASSTLPAVVDLPRLVMAYDRYGALPLDAAAPAADRAGARESSGDICLWMLSPQDQEAVCFDHPAEDSDPAWSPNGNWLAFLSDRGADGMRPTINRDIYMMTLAGTRLTRLTSEPNIDWLGPLTWSADGRWLAAVGVDRSNNSSWIYLISAYGEGRPRPIGHTRNGRLPRFAPVGTRLAYEMNDSIFHGLAVVDVETGAFIKVSEPDASLEPPSIADLGFDWSPTGDRLAYLVEKSLPDGERRREMRVSAPLDERYFARPLANEPGDSLTSPVEIPLAAEQGQVDGWIAWPVWLPGGEGLLYLQAVGVLELNLPGSSAPVTRPCLQPRLALLPERTLLQREGRLAPFCVTQPFNQSNWVRVAQAREVPWLVLAGLQPGETTPSLYSLMWPLADRAPGVVRLGEPPDGFSEAFYLRPGMGPNR